MIRSSSDSKKTFLKIDLLLQDNIIYVNIHNSEKGKEAYIISNETELNVTYGQSGFKQNVIQGMDAAEFAWDEPNKPKTVTVTFKLFDKIHSVEVSLE